MAHMYAMCAAINMPIWSYYPPQLYPKMSSEPYIRIIQGRGVKFSDPEICIMWSQMLHPDNLMSFTPNHFVTILKLQSEIEVVDLNNSNSSNKNGELRYQSHQQISINRVAIL